ncbi:nucleotide exchange factor GrpE [Wolbachia endosymbiont of Chironomus riparius]|uniref:nucleotide exchange factor GrpE n=1 Tax=Wolbachia endosymbiont of Chironomus riparius TaxID=2883238 RepID=UPI0020A0A659|nr:nucleotide exchange factor GrpE [Wolbachia endosymbiont of Chironomus riparius]
MSEQEKKEKFVNMVNKQNSFNKKEEGIDNLSDELNVLKASKVQLEDQLLRAIADNQNIKRIMQKQIKDAGDYSITNFARDMIDSCDNLKKAIENLQKGDPVHEGIKVAYQKIMNDLKKHEIEEINSLDKPFDSNFHQAVVEREDNEKEPGTVIEILQTGYIIKKRLLRPAMVIISKKGNSHDEN